MIPLNTGISGAFIFEAEKLQDERGFFARTWCRRDFEKYGLNPSIAQCSVSFNTARGTLRGMHYQAAPHPEAKLVRCTAGAIYDVIIDLREESPTYTRWYATELSAENHRMLYVPELVAHGFLTLKDNTEVAYQISEFYVPEVARGVRWNDPAFGIQWPLDVSVISARDAAYPDFVPSNR